ncbi:hypothetical protein LRAMOSA11136 [Lichtheimia ramosa]|uniref:Uncharacterized protein n=1 Tax=Lichtheimia ramosa TaxID=688394 RepID=A0A077WTK7_9FUNG|nr:hypothetical protein LRAMOSA11136 [Lichtheimia ramosa]
MDRYSQRIYFEVHYPSPSIFGDYEVHARYLFGAFCLLLWWIGPERRSVFFSLVAVAFLTLLGIPFAVLWWYLDPAGAVQGTCFYEWLYKCSHNVKSTSVSAAVGGVSSSVGVVSSSFSASVPLSTAVVPALPSEPVVPVVPSSCAFEPASSLPSVPQEPVVPSSCALVPASLPSVPQEPVVPSLSCAFVPSSSAFVPVMPSVPQEPVVPSSSVAIVPSSANVPIMPSVPQEPVVPSSSAAIVPSSANVPSSAAIVPSSANVPILPSVHLPVVPALFASTSAAVVATADSDADSFDDVDDLASALVALSLADPIGDLCAALMALTLFDPVDDLLCAAFKTFTVFDPLDEDSYMRPPVDVHYHEPLWLARLLSNVSMDIDEDNRDAVTPAPFAPITTATPFAPAPAPIYHGKYHLILQYW